MSYSEIYSDKITKGSRTYFFDIKKSENGSLYLKISESKKALSGFEHHRLMVFEEDVEDFVSAFRKCLSALKELKPKNKTYSVEKIRETHKRAYSPWTIEDDRRLELLFCEGKSVRELSQIFERNKGAITSRIKKLELKEKYE